MGPWTKLARSSVRGRCTTLISVSLFEHPVRPTRLLQDAQQELWLLAITNAFASSIIMDGLSAGTASAVASRSLLVLADLDARRRDVDRPRSGSCTRSPSAVQFSSARIYMGDTGSMFLGLLLGCDASRTATTRWERAGAALILGVPIFDMLFVIRLAHAGAAACAR